MNASHRVVRLAEAERLYLDAAELAGPRLTAMADTAGLMTITERHLQRMFRQALDELAVAASPPPSVSRRLTHGLKHEWPRLGTFDISLSWGDLNVFGELKCGEAELTLSACGWDAAKCVFCLHHGVGAGMVLVAAAPVAAWRTPGLGLELFSDAEWDMADIRGRYAKGFRKWEVDGYWPDYVFRRFRTSEVGRSSEFRIGGSCWHIEICRVEAVDNERMVWVPFVRESRPR